MKASKKKPFLVAVSAANPFIISEKECPSCIITNSAHLFHFRDKVLGVLTLLSHQGAHSGRGPQKKKAQKRQATLTLINVKENLQTLLLCLKKCNISFSVQTGSAGQGAVTAWCSGRRLAYEPHDGSLGMAHLAAFSRYSLQFALPDAPVAFADSPTKRWDGGGNGSLQGRRHDGSL